MNWAEEVQQKAKNTEKMDELGGRSPTQNGKHGISWEMKHKQVKLKK